MLKNTFIHIPGLGIKSEKRIWSFGIHSWDDLLKSDLSFFSSAKRDAHKRSIEDSIEHLSNKNVHYFSGHLPHNQYWRFFPEFRESTAYLDIETTALDPWLHGITVITLYDGKQIFSYIRGKNLDDFIEDVKKYSVVITYNGKRLDLPFLRIYMGLELSQPHIDLRYLLNSVGYTGGLKGCEKKAGIDRGDLKDLDGCSALLLWEEYQRSKNKKALETLLAYSAFDAVDLEALMVLAYNLKLEQTPFWDFRQLPPPELPEIPFKTDLETVLDLDYGDLVERGYHSKSINKWLYSYSYDAG
ncbi:MAG: ribonuclease H-like domain-containing protein [Deltaproteobacteria bacterium]|nr:ribonuclease H-like domain-containing protein [Deltaproteobacteria bacterium]